EPLAKSATVDSLFATVDQGHRASIGSNRKDVDSRDVLMFNVQTTEPEMRRVAFPLKPSYMCRFNLTDTNGVQLPKTPLGKDYGKDFMSLKAYSDCRMVPSYAAAGPYDASGSRNFHSVSDLFLIEEPGKYTLEMEI